MAHAKLDPKLLSWFISGQEKAEPIKEKLYHDIFPLQVANSNLPHCGIGDFIGVICSSYGAGNMDDVQVWFTDEEVCEKCKQRGYQLTVVEARIFLGQLLERGHRLIEYRENITIGRREYRRVKILHESAKKYFGVDAPSLGCEWPPAQEYRRRYNREL